MDLKHRAAINILDELIERYPELSSCQADILNAYGLLLDSYKHGGQLLIAGNGGSAADSDHISGELTKSFMFKRAADPKLITDIINNYGETGKELASHLEGGLAAIPLTTFNASNSAYANDVIWSVAFAQLINALGRNGDIFMGITTSGNSDNIVNALMVARCKRLKSIVLTGRDGGKCKSLADVCIIVPEKDTFKIQECHLPIYHALCAMVEVTLFEPRSS